MVRLVGGHGGKPPDEPGDWAGGRWSPKLRPVAPEPGPIGSAHKGTLGLHIGIHGNPWIFGYFWGIFGIFGQILGFWVKIT